MKDTGAIDQFFDVILSLETKQDCYSFFNDICTIKEVNEMAQRLQAAILLDKGKTYQDITKSMGISAATISRINRCLNYGDGGYKKAIESLKKINDNS